MICHDQFYLERYNLLYGNVVSQLQEITREGSKLPARHPYCTASHKKTQGKEVPWRGNVSSPLWWLQIFENSTRNGSVCNKFQVRQHCAKCTKQINLKLDSDPQGNRPV